MKEGKEHSPVVYDNSRYIHGLAPECSSALYCQLSRHQDILAMAQQLTNEGIQRKMSQALWCDEGQHPFSARDTGQQTVVVSGTHPDGTPWREERTVCSDHKPQFRQLPKEITGNTIQGSAEQAGDGAF